MLSALAALGCGLAAAAFLLVSLRTNARVIPRVVKRTSNAQI